MQKGEFLFEIFADIVVIRAVKNFGAKRNKVMVFFSFYETLSLESDRSIPDKFFHLLPKTDEFRV